MVDFKGYIDSFKLKLLLPCLLVFGLIYLIQEALISFYTSLFVEPILSKIPKNSIANILFLLLFFYSLNRLNNEIKSKQLPKPKSLLFVLTFLAIYILIIRTNSCFNFFGYDSWGMKWLTYSDIAFISFVFLFTEFRSYNKILAKNNSLSLIEDNSNPNKIIDKYGREKYLETIVSYIDNTTTDSSFVVGVFGDWGSGKTDFILRLKYHFEPNAKNVQNENIVVEFNPWKVSNKEAMIDDFFNALAQALKPFNKSVSSKIKEYSKKIFQDSKQPQFRAIDILLDNLINDQSIKDRYDSINELIKQTGMRLIILIDDLDRLTGDEVIEVLRLIRNTANFANTFFIVAIDHSYITDVLKKTKLLSNEQQYLKKIFQLVVTLPKIRKTIFRVELRNLMQVDKMPTNDQLAIDKLLDIISYDPSFFIQFGFATPNQESHLEGMLHNMRDIKRFANSFKISFEILKADVELLDLALLELLKVSCFDIYYKLSNREFLKLKGNSSTYVLDEDEWKTFSDLKEKKWGKSYTENLKALLSSLIFAGKKNKRALAYPNNFYLYFSYQLFNLIGLTEFNNAINLDVKEMAVIFKEWSLEKTAEFNNILDSYDSFKDVGEFKKFMLVFLLAGDDQNLLADRAVRNLVEYKKLIPRLFRNEHELLSFLNNIFSDSEIRILNRALIAKEFLKLTIRQNQDVIQSKNKWQIILLNLFNQHLNNSDKYDETVEYFYLFNEDSLSDDRHLSFNPEASKRLHDFISKDHIRLESFLNFFIRSYSIPNSNGIFVFNPFTTGIFGDWETFLAEVNNFQSSNATAIKIKELILKHFDEVRSSTENQFVLSGDDLKFMIAHLKSTGQLKF